MCKKKTKCTRLLTGKRRLQCLITFAYLRPDRPCACGRGRVINGPFAAERAKTRRSNVAKSKSNATRTRKWNTAPKISPDLLVVVRLLQPLVFGPAVLEPYLHLRFRQVQRVRQFRPPVPGHVLVVPVLHFQTQRLFRAERGPLATRCPAFFSPSPLHWNDDKSAR